jgi:hypothetical protein
MLAYVFWHWHGPQIEAGAYQHNLIAFHQALSAHKPRGFDSSMVLLAEQATWLGRDAPTYEDWYFVENSAALDPLNEGTLSGPCQEAHNQLARWTEGGTGGIFRLQAAGTYSPAVNFAWRFNKPAAMSYAALYELLRPATEETGVHLWVRAL